jgi:hypothetical protein
MMLTVHLHPNLMRYLQRHKGDSLNMKQIRTLILVIVGALSIIGTSLASAGTADPTIGIPILIPSNPTAQSKITFSVDVSGDDITSVKLNVEECNAKTGICHQAQNLTMNKVGDITYTQDVTLTYSDTTYITYWIAVQYGSLWKDSGKTKLNLSTQQPDHNNTNGSGDNKKQPGFEVPLVVIAVVASLILIGRKRSR